MIRQSNHRRLIDEYLFLREIRDSRNLALAVSVELRGERGGEIFEWKRKRWERGRRFCG